MVRGNESKVTPMFQTMDHGGMALSILLHLMVTVALLNIATPSHQDVDTPSMMVELTMEQVAVESTSSGQISPPVLVNVAPPATPRSVAKIMPPRLAASVMAPAQQPATISSETVGEIDNQVGAGMDDPTKPTTAFMAGAVQYDEYAGRMHDSIAQHRVYPPQSIRRREEGDVRLRILVATDGRLLQIHTLAEASSLLTQAARNAVENSAPFAPPPRTSVSDTQIAFDVTIVFRLR